MDEQERITKDLNEPVVEVKEARGKKASASPVVAAEAAPADPHPNRAKYEDGHLMGYEIGMYATRTEDELRADYVRAGNDPDTVDSYIGLIKEGLDFHGLEIGERYHERFPEAEIEETPAV